MDQKKYMDIQVLKPAISDGFRPGDHIVVQEKIDGANFSIRYDESDGTIKAFSRRKALTPLDTLRGAWNWAQNLDPEKIKSVLGGDQILFMEWLVSHTVKYPEDCYKNAYCYDIYDTATKKYLPQDIVKQKVDELGLTYVPVFYDGDFVSWDHLLGFVGKTNLGGEYGEGIVVKNQTRLNSENEYLPFYTKIVADKFRETKGHSSSKVVDPAQLLERERVQEITSSIVTEARVRKLLNKMVDDGIIPEDWDEHHMSIRHKRYRDNMLFIVGINFGLRASDLRLLRFSNLINENLVFKECFPVFEQKTRNTRKRKKQYRKRKSWRVRKMIYLDNASTTKIDSRVLDKMLPYLTERYGNPGNLHSLGKASKEAIDRARCQVAEMIGAQPENIIFTSGGSEANTLVFRGLSDLFLDKDLYSVATSNVEHKSVLRAADALYSRRVIQVSPDGSVSLQAVKDVCDEYDDIALVSVMHTNNETGSVSDVKAIAEFCNSRGILFHTDCVQAAGFSKLDVKEIGCDFMSISAHKIHGAKGVGALYVRDPSLLNPVIFGGDAQEFGIRGGTENVAGIVGFGYACQLISEGIATESNMMSCLCKLLQDSLLNNVIDKYGNHIAKVNGQIDADRRILNICFHGIDAETLLMALDRRGIAVSAGAACNNNESHPSYVLTNMGLSDEDAMSSIRLSLSRETSYADVVTAASEIVDIIKVLAQ